MKYWLCRPALPRQSGDYNVLCRGVVGDRLRGKGINGVLEEPSVASAAVCQMIAFVDITLRGRITHTRVWGRPLLMVAIYEQVKSQRRKPSTGMPRTVRATYASEETILDMASKYTP